MKRKYQNYLRVLRRKWTKHGSWLSGECPWCGEQKLFFYDRFDSICCLGCNVWLTKACSDPRCPFCSSRPETPLEALWLEVPYDGRRKDWSRDNYQHKADGRLRHEKKREKCVKIRENRERTLKIRIRKDAPYA